MAEEIEEETENIMNFAAAKIKEIEGQMWTYKKLAESATADLEVLRKKTGGVKSDARRQGGNGRGAG